MNELLLAWLFSTNACHVEFWRGYDYAIETRAKNVAAAKGYYKTILDYSHWNAGYEYGIAVNISGPTAQRSNAASENSRRDIRR